MSDQLPPHSPEAEQALLGCAIQDASIVADMKPEWFYDLRHRNVAEILQRMAADGKPIDTVTVTQAVIKAGIESGLIAHCLDAAPSAANAPYWVDELQGYETRRRIIRLAVEASQAAFNTDCKASELLDGFERDALAIRSNSGASEADLRSAVRELHSDYVAANEAKTHIGLSSGFYDLDRLLCGFRPGQLIILAARPSVGKTSLALNVAEKVALRGVPVGFFSLEMTAKELLHRLACSIAKIDGELLLSGRMEDEAKMRAMGNAFGTIVKSPLHIFDRGGATIAQLVSQGRRMAHRHGIKLAIVDYLGLIRTGANGRSRYEDTSAISAALKAMAKDLGLPILCLAQLNRDSEKEDRTPRLSDLRDSGSIEQDADVVLLLHRKHETNVQLIVAKNRAGRTGAVQLAFFPQYTRFESEAYDTN